MPEDSLQIIMTHPLVVKQHSDAVIYVYRSTLTAAAFHSVSRPANVVFSMKNTFLFERFLCGAKSRNLDGFPPGTGVKHRV